MDTCSTLLPVTSIRIHQVLQLCPLFLVRCPILLLVQIGLRPLPRLAFALQFEHVVELLFELLVLDFQVLDGLVYLLATLFAPLVEVVAVRVGSAEAALIRSS